MLSYNLPLPRDCNLLKLLPYLWMFEEQVKRVNILAFWVKLYFIIGQQSKHFEHSSEKC